MRILSIKAVFPKGLNKSITTAYPNINPIIKPEFKANSGKLNPHWIAGFSQADSSFGLHPVLRANKKLGYAIMPSYRITQHERDLVVLTRVLQTLGCGCLVKPAADRDRYHI